jgi:hypothetical protein
MGLFKSKEQKADIQHHERAAEGGAAQVRRMERAGRPAAAAMWQSYVDECQKRAEDGRRGRR